MPESSQYWHSINLTGVPAPVIASTDFNNHPIPLHIAGARDSAHGLFEQLDAESDPVRCGELFQDYMSVIFGFEPEQRLKVDHNDRRRYRSSYLRLIQDWGFDSSNAQGAVLKGWVESRFGLFPTYHKHPLNSFNSRSWVRYVEEKMNSRYHNNCIYMQLDLLYEFCQWFIARFRKPDEKHITLYRGVHALDSYCIGPGRDKQHKIVRFNNVISCTANSAIASEFGSHILELKVPLVKLVFFNDLLPHHALHGEAEFVVIGGDYEVRVWH